MIEIRAAALADAQALAALHAAAFAAPWDAQALARLLAQPGSIAVLAELQGFALLRVAADEAEILTLAVAPAARRRGIGSALVSQAAAKARDEGARTLFLEVAAINAAARALYARLGFAAAGRRRDYYGAGQDALLLKVQLPLGNPPQLD